MTRKFVFAFLPALAATAVVLSTGTASAATAKTYTVQPGDTLSRIADKQLGDASKWQALYATNRTTVGNDPNVIVPGQNLRLTTTANSAPSPTRPSTNPVPQPPAPTAPNTSPTRWDRLAQCESTGNWSINSGNGYYGGLQFSLPTWRAFGGNGMPHQQPRAEQIRIAEKVLRVQGPGAWPHCSYEAGMR
ncbi:transglycosylase family protein [Streptomyces sp. H27-C3]|uniref:transglycosylase family protein n=1 Tax=Streptomyces sp. H27-C3 TaxID=3046305 RepID=UPI0032D93408